MQKVVTEELKNKIILILVVWGDHYIDLLFKVSFPSQLAPGNLPALSENYKIRYLIYTTDDDCIKIKSHKLFKEIEKYACIEFVKIGFGMKVHKYTLMTSCHAHAIKMGANFPLVFLNPDAIYTDGAFYYFHRKIQEGKRAVIVSGIRLAKEHFFSHFDEEKHFSYRSRELVTIALQSMHPVCESFCWDNESIHQVPHHLYWKLDNEGILIRAFHQHPLMVWPEKINYPTSNIDYDYVQKACPREESWHFVTDSDQLFIFEISSLSSLKIPLQKRDSQSVALWMRNGTVSLHRKFIKNKIIMHKGIDLSKYATTIERSDEVIDLLLLKYHNMGIVKRFCCFFTFIKIKFKALLVKNFMQNGRMEIRGVEEY